jgi:hypothetical protein
MSDRWRAVHVREDRSAARVANLAIEAALNVGLDPDTSNVLGSEVARLALGYGFLVVKP